MSLWCDKYRPKSLSKLDYHKEQAEMFKKLVGTRTCTLVLLCLSNSVLFGRSTRMTSRTCSSTGPTAPARRRASCACCASEGAEKLRIERQEFRSS